jgi:hypothetical protein
VIQDVRPAEIRRQGPYFNTGCAQFRREICKRLRLACHESEVEFLGRELARERGADTFGSAHDEYPGPVLF